MAAIGLAILSGYLLGGIPSAYIIGRLWGKIDLRPEGDGHISATAVYRRLGTRPFITVLLMDLGKAVLAMQLARALSVPVVPLILTGYAVVIGHCWSVFLRFKGGLGALAMYGVLISCAPWEFSVGAAAGALVTFATRKTSLATYILLVVTSLVLLVERQDLLAVTLPLGLLLVQLTKRFQTRQSGATSQYRNELFDDLKRTR